jgi:hypothetical protein
MPIIALNTQCADSGHLFRLQEDDNLWRVAKTRLKSSFIYLANAVNDIRGNWSVLAIVIAPLALAVAFCLLPDALRLQHRLVQTFQGAGGQTVGFVSTQLRPDRPAAPVYPIWFSITLHPLLILITLVLKLVVLCALQRMQAKVRLPSVLAEGLAIYRRAIQLAPAFGLILLLQWLATLVGAVLLIVPGLLVYVWLYFAQYSLVFDGRHSWPALLFSRDLMRGRFFKVAMRIVVFLAVWSGYNSWAATVFIGASLLLGPVSIMTDSIAASIFMLDLFAVAVSYTTIAFFTAAGARLYQDLCAIAEEEAPAKVAAMQGTVPLANTAAQITHSSPSLGEAT